MAHASGDGSLDQSPRVHGIVAIVAERITNRVRHYDRGGKMDNGLDAMLGNQARHACLVPGVTDDKGGALRHRPIETGAEIIKHHDALASIEGRVNHVASDVAGAAGDQDSHTEGSLMSFGVAARAVVNIRLHA
jgi:hypothetical protein